MTLRLSITLSLHGPGVILDEGISSDLSRIGQEMDRIQRVYKGKVNVVVRGDFAFGAVLNSQPIWRGFIGEDIPT